MHDPSDRHECPYSVLTVGDDCTPTEMKRGFFGAKRRGHGAAKAAWDELRDPRLRLLHDVFHYRVEVIDGRNNRLPPLTTDLVFDLPSPTVTDLGDPLDFLDLELIVEPPSWGEGRAIDLPCLYELRGRGADGLPLLEDP